MHNTPPGHSVDSLRYLLPPGSDCRPPTDQDRWFVYALTSPPVSIAIPLGHGYAHETPPVPSPFPTQPTLASALQYPDPATGTDSASAGRVADGILPWLLPCPPLLATRVKHELLSLGFPSIEGARTAPKAEGSPRSAASLTLPNCRRRTLPRPRPGHPNRPNSPHHPNTRNGVLRAGEHPPGQPPAQPGDHAHRREKRSRANLLPILDQIKGVFIVFDTIPPHITIVRQDRQREPNSDTQRQVVGSATCIIERFGIM